MSKFSDRYPHEEPEVPITVREDAPQSLRAFLPRLAHESGISWSVQRGIVCKILMTWPNEDNWSEWPNIAYEVMDLLADCSWWHVYDVAEAYWEDLSRCRQLLSPPSNPTAEQLSFQRQLNGFFTREGIGWQLSTEGLLEPRGDATSSATSPTHTVALAEAGLEKALTEFKEAQHDLARRPDPDVTGVVQHGSAALESVVRHITGSSKTLGQAAKEIDYAAIPPVIRDMVETMLVKLYGYASSDRGGGRHGSESIQVNRAEAALFLGLVGGLIDYLLDKNPQKGT